MHPRPFALAMDEVQTRFHALGSGAPDAINLCLGGSAFDVRRFADLELDLGSHADGLRYGEPQGRRELRSLIAEIHREEHGADVDPDLICVTDGGSGGLVVALSAIVEPGSEVILPEISYPPFRLIVQLLGAKCVLAPLGESATYDLAALERLVTPRTAAIVVNTPSNPHGAALSRRALEHVASLGVHVVSDEVYGLLPYPPEPRAPSLIEITREHFVVGSFSKTYGAAGLRLGYVIAPERHVGRVRDMNALLTVCSSVPAQMLAERLLRRRREIAAAHGAFVRERRDAVVHACAEADLRLVRIPTAAFFALVDTSGVRQSTLEISLRLVDEHRVAVAPGVDFAASDPRFLRLNFAAAGDLDALRAAIRRVAAYLHH